MLFCVAVLVPLQSEMQAVFVGCDPSLTEAVLWRIPRSVKDRDQSSICWMWPEIDRGCAVSQSSFHYRARWKQCSVCWILRWFWFLKRSSTFWSRTAESLESLEFFIRTEVTVGGLNQTAEHFNAVLILLFFSAGQLQRTSLFEGSENGFTVLTSYVALTLDSPGQLWVIGFTGSHLERDPKFILRVRAAECQSFKKSDDEVWSDVIESIIFNLLDVSQEMWETRLISHQKFPKKVCEYM